MTMQEYRKQAGLTQAQLAQKAGTNERSIRKYENGTSAIKNMPLYIAVAVSAELNIHPAQLLEGAKNEHQNA